MEEAKVKGQFYSYSIHWGVLHDTLLKICSIMQYFFQSLNLECPITGISKGPIIVYFSNGRCLPKTEMILAGGLIDHFLEGSAPLRRRQDLYL